MAKFSSTGITFRLNQNCDEISITQPPHKMLIRYKLRAAWQLETAREEKPLEIFSLMNLFYPTMSKRHSSSKNNTVKTQ